MSNSSIISKQPGQLHAAMGCCLAHQAEQVRVMTPNGAAVIYVLTIECLMSSWA